MQGGMFLEMLKYIRTCRFHTVIVLDQLMNFKIVSQSFLPFNAWKKNFILQGNLGNAGVRGDV